MNGLIIKNVDFYGDNLVAAKDPQTGKIYTGANWVCNGLGLDARRQREKMQEHLTLKKGVSTLPLPSNGGIQDTLAIDINFLPLWLATVNPALVNKGIKDKLIDYQLKAKDVLAQAFIEPKKQLIINKMQGLSPQLQMFGQMFEAMASLELRHNEMAEEVAATKEQINTIKDTIVNRNEDWRKDVNKKLRKIGFKYGKYDEFVTESYEILEARARCDLKRRLENYRDRLEKSGATKTAINKANYLDVISQDERLKEIYINIVNQLYVKHAA